MLLSGNKMTQKGDIAMVNKPELKSVMCKHGDRQEDLAAAMNISPATLSAKINGDVEFKGNEIEFIAIRYSLVAEEIRRIFFINAVACAETN